MIHSAVTAAPIDTASHEALVAGPESGAVVGFSGVVRDHDAGRRVTKLVYEAHPDAEKVLTAVATDIAALPQVSSVAVSHRTGELAIGDVALAAAVSAPHRAEAFHACAHLVDEVKRLLPVWKHQFFADGTDEWVNCP